MSIRSVIVSKAEFISYMGRMEQIFPTLYRVREMLQQVEKMPTRGLKQREAAQKARQECFDILDQLQWKLGADILDTVRFIERNKDLLPAALKKKLKIKD